MPHKAVGNRLRIAAACAAMLLAALGGCRMKPAPSQAAAASSAVTAKRSPSRSPAAEVRPVEKPPSSLLAPDCLLVGRISDAQTLSARIGEMLSALDPHSDAPSLRAVLGQKLFNPKLVGVSLAAPFDFFYMNPKKYPRPWVYQFEVTDADALKRAVNAKSRPQAAGEGLFRFADLAGIKGQTGWLHLHGNRATWSLDPRPAESLRGWQRTRKAPILFHTPGQLHFRADIPKLLNIYEKEIIQQTRKMKDRMRVAITRSPARSGTQHELASTQADLDAAIAWTRQVKSIEMGIEMAADSVRFSFNIKPLQNSALAGFCRTHAGVGLPLLYRCPRDAALVVAHNLSAKRAFRTMLVRALGWGPLEHLHRAALRGKGRTLVALFLPVLPGGPMELVELRTDQKAQDVWQRWEHFAAPTPATAASLPFTLRPRPVKDADAATFRLAEIIPNRAVLGPVGTKAFRRLLGARPLAAQAARKGRSVLVISAGPRRRIGQIRALARRKARSLPGNPAFRKTTAGLPAQPALLIYVSPRAVRRWLALAQLRPGPPKPEDLGLAMTLACVPQGQARIHIRIPTTALRRALLRKPKVQPPRRRERVYKATPGTE